MGKRSIWIVMLPTYLVTFITLFAVVLFLSRSISASVENIPYDNRSCVIIDPGHGGVDSGAISCSGALESHINLEISLRLNDLMHYLGLNTIIIRDTDRSVYTDGNSIAEKKISDLKERVRIVNQQENGLLISIHQNHFSDTRYYGPQVFYGGVGESKALALHMQEALTSILCPESNRKSKKSTGIYLMEKINCAGLLIECGFLSNYEEEVKLRNEAYQKKLSAVIATVCAGYLNNTTIA